MPRLRSLYIHTAYPKYMLEDEAISIALAVRNIFRDRLGHGSLYSLVIPEQLIGEYESWYRERITELTITGCL